MATVTALTATALGLYIYSQNRSNKEPTTTSLVVDESQPPSTWSETLFFFKEVVRYAFGQTLGRWYTLDLFIGLAYLSHREALDYPAADIARQAKSLLALSEPSSSSEDSPADRDKLQTLLLEMNEVRRYLLFCRGLKFKMAEQLEFWRVHLEIDPSRVLSQQPNAGLLRPAHALLVDDRRHCVLLCIRGTSGLKDLLTSLTATTKPHHKVQSSGVILGYGHLGMLAAARFLLKQNRDLITRTMKDHEGYRLVLVGHSMGAGIAVLLTMMLREMVPGCSDARCYAMACPACMTLELATSCKDYVTSVIHGTDIVPTFSAATVDTLRDEVMHSSWFAEFQRDLQSSMFRAVQGGIRGVGTAGMWTARNILQPVAMPFRSCINQRGSSSSSSRQQLYASASPSEAQQREAEPGSQGKEGEGEGRSSGINAQQLRRRLWPWGGGGGGGSNIGFDAASSMSYAGWVDENSPSSSEPSNTDGASTPSKPSIAGGGGWWWPLTAVSSNPHPPSAADAATGAEPLSASPSSAFRLPSWSALPASSLLQACTNALGTNALGRKSAVSSNPHPCTNALGRKSAVAPSGEQTNGMTDSSTAVELSSIGAREMGVSTKDSEEEVEEEEEDDYEGGISALENGRTAAVLLSSLGNHNGPEGSRRSQEVDSSLPAVGLIGPSDHHLEQGISAVVEAMAQGKDEHEEEEESQEAKGDQKGKSFEYDSDGDGDGDEPGVETLPTSTSASDSRPTDGGPSASSSSSSTTIRRHLYPAGRILHLFPQVAVTPQSPREDGTLPQWDPEGLQSTSRDSPVSREEFAPTPRHLKPSSADITATRVAQRQSPYLLYEVSDVTVYTRIKLCRTMVLDHLTPSYLTAVASVVEQLERRLGLGGGKGEGEGGVSLSSIPVSIDTGVSQGQGHVMGGASRRRGGTLMGPDGEIL